MLIVPIIIVPIMTAYLCTIGVDAFIVLVLYCVGPGSALSIVD